jgi:hypothetical protein
MEINYAEKRNSTRKKFIRVSVMIVVLRHSVRIREKIKNNDISRRRKNGIL